MNSFLYDCGENDKYGENALMPRNMGCSEAQVQLKSRNEDVPTSSQKIRHAELQDVTLL